MSMFIFFNENGQVVYD